MAAPDGLTAYKISCIGNLDNCIAMLYTRDMTSLEYSAPQQTALDLVHESRQKLHDAEMALHRAVWDARGVGCSWADLAPVFGTTRSAVQQRFTGTGAR